MIFLCNNILLLSYPYPESFDREVTFENATLRIIKYSDSLQE